MIVLLPRHLCIAITLLAAGLCRAEDLSGEYEKEILPIMVNYCYDCHGDGMSEGHLKLDKYRTVGEMIADRKQWQKIRDHIDFRLMPPPDEYAPDDKERAKLVRWIDNAVFAVDPENPDPGHTTLRRLNRREYQNTIKDLLGVEVDVLTVLPVDDSGYGFDNIGDVLTISPLHMERYLEAAEMALDAAVDPRKPSHSAIYGKGPDGLGDREYMLSVMGRYLEMAFRRSAQEGEVERYLIFLDRAKSQGQGVEQAIRQALSAVLSSPSFLFREDPVLGKGVGGKALINEYALASRLSYFLWSTMPDGRLRELAGKGELRENLRTEVRRMVESPKSAEFVANFVGQWLQLRDMEAVTPDKRVYGTLEKGLRDSMRKETEMLVRHVMKENLPIHTLLSADYTFLNGRLAKHYGIGGVSGDEFRMVPLKGTPRRGILGHASVLTLTSHPTRTSPVLRGKYVLENILNTPPPPAPPNVPPLAEGRGNGSGMTLREELEIHRKDPACASCHALMDPIGFGMENYDGIGRWREQDRGKPLDVSGKLASGQEFATAEEMRDILITDFRGEFHRAVAVKMLTYALGRGVEYYDRPAIDEIVLKAGKDDGRFLSWITAVAESVPFQYRRK